MRNSPRILVIGFGNPDRQDDAAGVLALRELRDHLPEYVQAVEAGLDVFRMLSDWPESGAVIFIDAVRTGAPPGTVHRWAGHEIPACAQTSRASSHGFSLLDVLNIASALQSSQPQVCLIGIEADEFHTGAPLSEAVAAAIPQASELVLEELRRCTNTA